MRNASTLLSKMDLKSKEIPAYVETIGPKIHLVLQRPELAPEISLEASAE